MRIKRYHFLVASLAIAALCVYQYVSSPPKVNVDVGSAIATVVMPTSQPTIVVHASTSTLIIEPDDGISPVAKMVQGASSSVDLVMYQNEDGEIDSALAADAARGVTVRVLLNKGYYGKEENAENEPAHAFLTAHGVQVHWTPSYFALTHQKTLVVDGETALVMTFNLTPQYYRTSRDFGIIDQDKDDVAAIEKTFDADWQGTKITAPTGNALVWSPGSEGTMLSTINGAKKTLDIYNEEMADTRIESALEAAAKRGVVVEVDMTDDASYHAAFTELETVGVAVRTYSPKALLYIHAKMILVDGTHAFVGSENFSTTSLDHNRELGLMVSDPAVIGTLSKTFRNDWQGATAFVAK